MLKFLSIKELESFRKSSKKDIKSEQKTITICGGTGCIALGSKNVIKAFKQSIEKFKLQNKVRLLVTGCHGFCEKGPLVVIRPEGIFYQQVSPNDTDEIVEKTILNNKIVEKLLYIDPNNGKKYIKEEEVPFYRNQKRIIFSQNGFINPQSIDDYIINNGYTALSKVLKEFEVTEVIKTIKASDLRGRGGGGFPTGKKWESCRKAKGELKYVICNADEGDPGAYMDRSILEGNPHSVLEGMIIGAYAIGSNEGYIYVRQEYPLAVENFKKALEDAREYGLLGKNILNTGFDFDVQISRGGGAFVCGESTALMASIEGRPGEPRAKHVHTVEKGLWDKPTTLNNVETWANIPLIINRGADWFVKIGTEKSKGTKIFSLVGKVNNTGLVEVPMGITLREIIYNIGGGIKEGKEFKAVQTGGPSGGCIPKDMLDLPVDFEKLSEAGSMMGSGGMIVLDEDNCMVDIAKYFTNFLKDESCGKCTPCREGLVQLSDILEKISNGKGSIGDIDKLEELSFLISETSLCQLGTTAPNPVLTTLKYFREEYEAHIIDKRCPSHVCKELVEYTIDPELCTGCTLCMKKCPENTIEGKVKEVHRIIQENCLKCGICYEVCKFNAVIRN